uniref:hypothetical protein n=1 Tax=Pseudoalteromonas sp. (strain SANK 73390) TaxID=747457 RepID=UPI00159ECAAD|nr:hypothetical protein [Pseudoalteromonas sp. SANK 73390]
MSNEQASTAKALVISFIDQMNRSEYRGSDIRESFELKNMLNIDSLNKLILLTRITEHLGVEFGESDITINDFTTVSDLISFVETHTRMAETHTEPS